MLEGKGRGGRDGFGPPFFVTSSRQISMKLGRLSDLVNNTSCSNVNVSQGVTSLWGQKIDVSQRKAKLSLTLLSATAHAHDNHCSAVFLSSVYASNFES
jgi:hypothetical protein